VVPTVTEAGVDAAIFRGGATTAIVAVEDLVWLGSLESVRVRLKEKFPVTAGVPEMMPVVGDSETPEGRLPAVTLQV
jgi:hypothetical protein